MVWLKYDLPAGISVFFVALPLCLGIAMASGAPLYAGIMSGIIGGMVVSLISGSQLGVSGPAAGLTSVVAAAIASSGDYRVFLLSVVIAGIFQLLLGIFKLGAVAYYFPSAVIKGMLAAIGIILISKQIPIALGYNLPDFWSTAFSQKFFSSVSHISSQIHIGVIIISLSSIAVFLVHSNTKLKNWRFFPYSIGVVLLAVFLGKIYYLFDPKLYLDEIHLVNLPDNIFNDFVMPDFSALFVSKQIWENGLTIGLLATLETLLCVEAVDKLDKQNRITPVNRELIAHGIGNILCGMVGALPITAVVVRGAANVQAGARTKLSAFTHGLLLLLAVLLLADFIKFIPDSALAIILIITGFKMAKPSLFKNMALTGFRQFAPFIITIIMILFTDLLMGVSIGLLISIYYIIKNNYNEEFKVIKHSTGLYRSYTIKLNTNVTFLNKVNLRKALDAIPEYSLLTVDGSECNFVDYDILEIISEFETKAELKNIQLDLINIKKVKTTSFH